MSAPEGQSGNTMEKEIALRYAKLRQEYKAQIDPAKFPGTMSLVYELDIPTCVLLRDGSTIIGELLCFDSRGNIVMARARERTFGYSGPRDSNIGMCTIKSGDIVLVGTIDKEKDAELFNQPPVLEKKE